MSRDQPHSCARGISLLEVLVAIGILSIGLASVFALIPAGGTLAAKAVSYDRSRALAENAINDFLTRGFHNPRTWIPSPLQAPPGSREWPFASTGAYTANWTQPPLRPPRTLVFDPLDEHVSEIDPTQPVRLAASGTYSPLTFAPVWIAPGSSASANTYFVPCLRLSANPFRYSGLLPAPGGALPHPFRLEPQFSVFRNSTDDPPHDGTLWVNDLFRSSDDVSYAQPENSDALPTNIFSAGSLGTRGTRGAYSALFMLTALGPASPDWTAGEEAFLTVVVFQNRSVDSSPVVLRFDDSSPPPPGSAWSASTSAEWIVTQPLAGATASYGFGDLTKPGTYAYEPLHRRNGLWHGQWWKLRYAPPGPATPLQNGAAIRANQCVWESIGPIVIESATALAPNLPIDNETDGPEARFPIFVFPDVVHISHRLITLASDNAWSR